MRISGIDVILYLQLPAGADELGNPVVSEIPLTVSNVLVSPSTDQEITDSLNLYGKKAKYTLSIPKGDTNDWENKRVDFFGEHFRTIGNGLRYIEHLTPGNWDFKVMVESITKVTAVE